MINSYACYALAITSINGDDANIFYVISNCSSFSVILMINPLMDYNNLYTFQNVYVQYLQHMYL